MLTCFDVNFPELWASARARQADLVVWPSAMVTPDLVSHAYARLHQLAIVAVSGLFGDTSTSVAGEIVDSTGDPLANTTRPTDHPKMVLGTLDLGKVWVHADNNVAKIAALLEAAGGAVRATAVPAWQPMPPHSEAARRDLPFYLLERTAKGAAAPPSVADRVRDHGIEPLWQYISRSRRVTNELRQQGRAIPR